VQDNSLALKHMTPKALSFGTRSERLILRRQWPRRSRAKFAVGSQRW
jgi:hypothetical protein